MNKIINDYCTFCERRENVPNQLFAESDNFFAFFTLGHMVEGYSHCVKRTLSLYGCSTAKLTS